MADQAHAESSLPEPTEPHAALLRAALDSFVAGRSLSETELGALSSLSQAGRELFRATWSGLEAELRASLLPVLSAVERHDARLDFTAVYQVALADPDPEVRQSALAAIVADDSATLLDAVLDLLKSDPSEDVRAAAASALAPYAYRAEVGELPSSLAARIERALLETTRAQSQPERVRAAALGSLGYFSDEQAQEQLAGGYQQPWARLGALRGMGRSADPRWLPRLLDSFRSDDPAEREEAARAAGELEDARAVSALVDLIEDPSIDVRLAALRALGQIGGEEAREALLYAIGDESEVIRSAAERALTELEANEDELDDFEL